ncbi:MAG TPA: TetR/AcrR family transcriptional regulator [Rhodopila sp.]|uniref:TetR/AcrR family transcriptional regulator n=1 Tax=Rhodopila sp. TaxID=2480087 RepID=UPI002BC2E456|nr:TetR/AcrR family transcriptional regulator [Rhodopila sp.]HVY18361.1 TetR/AcrR family transcriptional regulator [Rhodopila sp.]
MSHSGNGEIPRRGPGRPPVRSDEDTLRLILDAASQVFRADGYAGAGMSRVAQQAGVSTKTLYRLVPTKADLLRRVIAARTRDFVLGADHVDDCADGVQAGLERLLTQFATLTLSADVLDVYRLVLSESGRFPEIARTFYEEAIIPTTDAMAAWLDRQCRAGLIRLEDTRLAAEMLRGMMILEPQRAAMLRRAPPPTAAEIAARARACAARFLGGCLAAGADKG